MRKLCIVYIFDINFHFYPKETGIGKVLQTAKFHIARDTTFFFNQWLTTI